VDGGARSAAQVSSSAKRNLCFPFDPFRRVAWFDEKKSKADVSSPAGGDDVANCKRLAADGKCALVCVCVFVVGIRCRRTANVVARRARKTYVPGVRRGEVASCISRETSIPALRVVLALS
jgi:hypothetical protein